MDGFIRRSIILGILVITALCHPGIDVFGEGWEWSNPYPTGVRLAGIWGSSADDIFAVGAAGTIIHYNGAGWEAMLGGGDEMLAGVGGGSGSDVYAVGTAGTILHYDGSGWAMMTSPTAVDLNGVWVGSPGDVFAVGGDFFDGVILHYNGAAWSEMTVIRPLGDPGGDESVLRGRRRAGARRL